MFTSYITALNNFQTAGGVIVFAAGNYTGESDVSVFAALPELFPDLAEAYLAVGFIDTSGSSILSTSNVTQGGNKCGSAAQYCLVTDGTDLRGAQWVDSGTSYYKDGGSGSSYSAPMVTGAIALLNQAFPNHTAEAIVDRLLASANNSWFTPEGNTTFTTHGNSITHGYHTIWGHGIPDLYAALSPITSNGNPASIALYVGNNLNNTSESSPFIGSNFTSAASFGDALSVSFKNKTSYFYDALNGGFQFNFNYLFSNSRAYNSIYEITNIIKSDINRLQTILKIQKNKNYKYSFSNVFGKIGDENESLLAFSIESPSAPVKYFNQLNNTSETYLATLDNPFTDPSKIGFGINGKQNFGSSELLYGYHNTGLRINNETIEENPVEIFSLALNYSNKLLDNMTLLSGLMIEENTLLDSEGSGALGFHGSNPKSLFAGLNLEKVINDDLFIKFVATVGYSTVETPSNSLIGNVSEITSTSFNVILNKQNIFTENDFLSFSLSQPNRIEDGTMVFRVPGLADREGNLTYDHVSAELAPTGRQLDFAIDYITEINDDLRIGFKNTFSSNYNHTSDNSLNFAATLTARYTF